MTAPDAAGAPPALSSSSVPLRFDELHTARLLMRRWRPADRDPFAQLNSDPEVMRYFPAVLSSPESDALIDRFELLFESQGVGLWALEVRDTGQFIGFTGLTPMPPGTPGAGGLEVGWRLARAAWHLGYASEAARAAVEIALQRLELDQVWSMTAVLNFPSHAVMRRIGMTLHSRFEHPRLDPGSPLRPHVAYRIARG